MNNTFIVAEVGSNHNRDWKLAKQLVQSAVEAKCDIIKFQTFTSDTMYSRYTPDFAGHTNIPKLIESLELPCYWQKDLKNLCDDKDIEFMSTPFDENAIDSLVTLGVKRLKIAGFESTDFRFLKLAASTKLPLIISLGIDCDSNTRTKIVHTIYETNPDVHLTVLHCNNAYPTPFEDINLGTILEIKRQMQSLSWNGTDYYINRIKVGLSDHTKGILIPPVAVGLGAELIEKHFTMNKKSKGPDHHFAIEPHELKQMVQNIRNVEASFGTRKKNITNSEQNEKLARRAVYAKKEIKKGDFFTTKNITTKRPFIKDSISAQKFYEVLGKQCNKYIMIDKPIKYEYLEL